MENLIQQRNDKMDIETQTLDENREMRSFRGDMTVTDIKSPPQQSVLGYPAGFSYAITLGGQQSYNLTSRRVLDLLTFLVKNSGKVSQEIVKAVENQESHMDKLIGMAGHSSIARHATQLDALLNLVVGVFKTNRSVPTAEDDSRPTVPTVSPLYISGLISLYNLHRTLTEAAFKHLRYILEQLSVLPENRAPILEGISSGALESSTILQNQLVDLRNRLSTTSQHPASVLAVISTDHETGLLRRVRTLSSILSTIRSTTENSEPDNMSKYIRLEKLWDSLEAIMNSLDSEDNMGNGASLTLSPLLPIIEIFFITHSQSQSQTPQIETAEHQRFLSFAERYRKFLNELVRQSPTLLEETFGALLTTPQLLDFENKRTYFRSQITKEKMEDRGESIRLHVARDQVMNSSFIQLIPRTAEEMKGKLTVIFDGEEGIDAGGVSREWYTILAKEMFNPNYCLFIPTADSAFQPNKDSAINPDHLRYFKFIGRVIGKALYDNQLLDAHFTRSFYKHILGAPIGYTDIEAIDPEYYKNLKWILDNDINDVIELTFSAQREEFGALRTDDLKPDGRNIAVTNETKKEYVELITQHKMSTAIRQQIDNFLAGFHEIIKPQLISIFTPSELELLISGLPDIDTEDLRKNTEYKGFTSHSPAIQWFWQVVKDMNQEDKALLLQFVTGTSKVPLEGFKALQGMNGPTKFSIHKAYESHRLPTAHTCFNQLDLPEYGTFEEMKKNLLIAVRMGAAGFGFG